MAKFYYSKQRQRYEVSEYNPKTGDRTLIDHDVDFETLGIRQGFISDDEDCDLAEDIQKGTAFFFDPEEK